MKFNKVLFAIMIVTGLNVCFTTKIVIAQLRTDSNTVRTKVGNPSTSTAGVVACPLIAGTVTCGPSKPQWTYYSGCQGGHCAGDYSIGSWCAAGDAQYAADISGVAFQETFLPSIYFPDTQESHSVTCKLASISTGQSSGQDIFAFSCSDDVTGGFIYIDFHHMYSGNRPAFDVEYKTGDLIGKLDPNDGPHAHVQIGINGGCGGGDLSGCVAADKYLQCI